MIDLTTTHNGTGNSVSTGLPVPIGDAGSTSGVAPTPSVPSTVKPPDRMPTDIHCDERNQVTWFVPPIPTNISDNYRRAGDSLAERFPQFPERIWQVCFDMMTRVEPASQMLERITEIVEKYLKTKAEQVFLYRKELNAEIARLTELIEKHAATLTDTKVKFITAMAEAQLPWTKDGAITPAAVETAINEAVPNTDEFAGLHHLRPPTDHKQPSIGKAVETLFVDGVLPILMGGGLGFLIGGIIDFITKADILRGDCGMQLTALTLFGTGIVIAIGGTCCTAIRSLARVRSIKKVSVQVDGDQPPQTDEAAVTKGFLISTAILLLGEILAESVGLHAAHLFELERLRQAGHPGHELPFIVYVIMATILSASYIKLKAGRTWDREHDDRLMVWLASLQFKWQKEKRESAETKAALTAAGLVYFTEVEINQLSDNRSALQEKESNAEEAIKLDPAMQKKLEAAQAAAIGERGRVDSQIQEILDDCEYGRRRNAGVPDAKPFFTEMTALNQQAISGGGGT